MAISRILIAGCGELGSRLGVQLASDGHEVIGLRRNINQLPVCIQPIKADLTSPESFIKVLQQLGGCDILVYCAAASMYEEEHYRQVYLQGLQQVIGSLVSCPSHVFFTSSTGVYHQDEHEHVDETSVCLPVSFSGKVMLEAESWLSQAVSAATAIRFSGIYGSGRNALVNRVRQGQIAPAQPLCYSNRIHSDDAVGVLYHLINLVLQDKKLDSCYLASDDQPASLHEVTTWLARELGVDAVDETLMRFAGSKRCDNGKLRSTGYCFRYPSYRDGYATVLASG